MASSGILRLVALVKTEVSEELSASFIIVTRIGEIGKTLALPSLPLLVTMMKEALSSSETRFLQEPYGVTSQKRPFFIATAVKTSNLTTLISSGI
jgi:hypothetical protein